MDRPLAELALRLGDALRRRGATLAVVESCTGGSLGAAITSVAGASDYFVGGMITYSVLAKQALLGVSPELLERHGPVSGEVAAAMAQRMRKLAESDFSLSVTGNAGPTTDSGEQSVGVVFLGLAGERAGSEHVEVARHQFAGTRIEVQRQAVRAALRMLLHHVTETRSASL